jgi:hypothetical protein
VQLNFTGLRYDVDGKIWTKSAGTQHIVRLDLATNKCERFHPTDYLQDGLKNAGIYQVIADSQNNLWMSCWRDVRAVYPPSRPPFLFLHRTASGNWSSTEIGLNLQRKMDVPLRFGWHISLAAAARCAFRLSRAASASGKGPALMGLGGDARVQSIPRAANRTYGAEGTR